MSVEKTLHVVAFDVPFPPDYGGVIDIYLRCKALKNNGYTIILHCFEYGRGRNHAFQEVATEVHYYTRSKRLLDWFSQEPFIVRTRASQELLNRLTLDNYPILFEGQHTTAFLNHPALSLRRKMVRLHNIEWQYYAGLAERTTNWIQRRYFGSESRKLKQHEKVLSSATVLACISHSDTNYYSERFSNVVYMPVAFSADHQTPVITAEVPFFLFHGNLSVAENEEAAQWLIEAFSTSGHTLVLAGKNPSVKLRNACEQHSNVRLVSNPSTTEMADLMASAKAHLVIGFQQSGIKLKLLHSLMTGKRCIVTPAMIAGTGLENWCTVVSNEVELQKALELPELDTSEQEAQKAFILSAFSTDKTVEIIARYLIN